MKIKLLVSRSGPGGVQNADDELTVPGDVSKAEAKRMLEAGQAVPVRAKKAERAVARPKPEKATKA